LRQEIGLKGIKTPKNMAGVKDMIFKAAARKLKKILIGGQENVEFVLINDDGILLTFKDGTTKTNKVGKDLEALKIKLEALDMGKFVDLELISKNGKDFLLNLTFSKEGTINTVNYTI
jgi:hypothetical protein